MKNFVCEKSSYAWNAAAGLINASEAVVLLVVVTRVGTLEDAGVLTLAFAVANLFVNVGKFGMKDFQVTDRRERYSFQDYACSRVITACGMLLLCTSYIAFQWSAGNYTSYKAKAVFLVCMLFVMEALEDVIWGRCQQKNRLDAGAKIFSIRWICVLCSFSLCLICTKDLLLSATLAVIVCALCLILCTLSVCHILQAERHRVRRSAVLQLLRECMPLFIAAFCSFYVINAAKYSIDVFLSDGILACYGFVSMPVFVIGLFSSFFFQPTLVRLSICWQQNDQKQFRAFIRKQLQFITAGTAVCLVGAWTVGVPVLSLLFQVNLADYRRELMLLVLGGGFYALSTYLQVLLIMMRRQKWFPRVYLLVSCLAWLLMNPVTAHYGAVGAAVCSVVIFGILALLWGLFVLFYLSQPGQAVQSDSGKGT